MGRGHVKEFRFMEGIVESEDKTETAKRERRDDISLSLFGARENNGKFVRPWLIPETNV